MNIKSKRSVLLKRKTRRSETPMPDNSDGLLDVLCNVVGLLVLVSSLTGVIASTTALNIIAPMSQKTEKNFHMLQASEEGIWDLQPAVNRMTILDRERGSEVLRCSNLLPPEAETCNRSLDGWSREEQLSGIKMSLTHEKGSLLRQAEPTISYEDLKNSNEWLENLMKKLSKTNRAVFVVLESDGFEIYRLIKRQALINKVPIGWEPWYKGDPIYFWGNSGRSMLSQ